MQAEEAVRTLAGRYELEGEIARGGMGVVWRARDTLLGRPVAVKEIFPPRTAGDGDPDGDRMRARVLREARAAAALHHPGIVTVYDLLEDDGGSYIVMELLDAESLHDTVALRGPLDVHRTIELGRQTASALRAAHEHGITHRDVKPRNVLLLGDGRVKLADFGISSVKDDTSLTATGEVVGSPAFMSPEQAQGEPASARTDLWGLGATLYYAVEGASPFGEGEAIPTLRAVVHDPPRPMRRAGSLAPIISALLAKDPAARPAEEDLPRLFDDAETQGAATATSPLLIPGLEGAATAVEPTERTEAGSPNDQEPPRRRSWIVAGALAAALAIAVVIGLVAFAGGTSPAPARTGTRHVAGAQHASPADHRHQAERSSPPTETPPTQATPSPAPATEAPPATDHGNSGSSHGVANGHDGGPPGNQHGEGDNGNGDANGQGGQALAPAPAPTQTDSPEPTPSATPTKESNPLD
jgi:serine/threonine protein kinase